MTVVKFPLKSFQKLLLNFHIFHLSVKPSYYCLFILRLSLLYVTICQIFIFVAVLYFYSFLKEELYWQIH